MVLLLFGKMLDFTSLVVFSFWFDESGVLRLSWLGKNALLKCCVGLLFNLVLFGGVERWVF